MLSKSFTLNSPLVMVSKLSLLLEPKSFDLEMGKLEDKVRWSQFFKGRIHYF